MRKRLYVTTVGLSLLAYLGWLALTTTVPPLYHARHRVYEGLGILVATSRVFETPPGDSDLHIHGSGGRLIFVSDAQADVARVVADWVAFAPLVAAIASLSTLVGMRLGRQEHLRCPECGYILKGLAKPRCPECGRPI